MKITLKISNYLDLELFSEENSLIGKWAVIFKKFESKDLASKYVDEIGMIYPISYFSQNGTPVAECFFNYIDHAKKTSNISSAKSIFALQEDSVKIFESFNEAKKFSDRLLLLK